MLVHISQRNLTSQQSIVIYEHFPHSVVELPLSEKISTVFCLHHLGEDTSHRAAHKRVESKSRRLMDSCIEDGEEI